MAGVRILCDDIATSPGGETVPVSGSILAGIKTEGEETSQYNSVSSCDSSGYPSIKLETKDNLCETGAVSSDNCNSPAIKVDPLKLEPEEMLSGTDPGGNEPEVDLETRGNVFACSDTGMIGYNSDIDIKEEWDREAENTEESDEDMLEHVASPTPCTAIQSDSTGELSQPKGEKPVPNTPSMGSSHRKKDEGEVRVYMDPPVERPEADSDKDSDDSDEPSGSTKHLPRRLLGTRAEAQKRKRGQSRPVQPPAEAEANFGGAWQRADPGLVGSNIPPYVKPALSAEDELILEGRTSAYDFYRLFQPDEFAREAVAQSKLYAEQKTYRKAKELVTEDTYRCTEALLLHSGYHNIPQRRMIWEAKPDCHNNMIVEAIRRDEVDAVLKCLHFRDNNEMDSDSFYKIRPIFSNLNMASRRWNASEGVYSIDETMIPYFGRHSAKQFIYGKPIRYGYKVWTLATADGCGVWFEPYCGRNTQIHDSGLGQGPNVVLDLVEKAELAPGSELAFDNLFNSFPLLEKLSEQQLAGTGTVRQNRLCKVPVKKKKEMEAKTVPRGTSDVIYSNDVVVVGWKDNKAVYMASNKYGASADKTCRRYSCTDNKYIQVPIPEMFCQYNSKMGGVDLLDSMVAVYRVQYHMKKWWWPFYPWSLSVSAVNAWRLRMRITGKKEPFLNFMRELVTDMVAVHGRPPRRRDSMPAEAPINYDSKDHWPANTDLDSNSKPKMKNCKHCYESTKKQSKTTIKCRKCNMLLHALCFEGYHTNNAQ